MKTPPYVALALKSQDICFARALSYLDEDAECFRVLDQLSRCLTRLESWATCTDGCHGGDHLLERLSCRVIGHAAASVRLAFSGHYDEAIALERAVGELANLLSLFSCDAAALEDWKQADDRKRRNAYAPVAVRKRLETLGGITWMDQGTYGSLSERTIHPTPGVTPQVYELGHQPSVGTHFQGDGLRWALFELAVQVAGFTRSLSQLVVGSEAERERIDEAGKQLLLSVPGVELASDDG